MICVEIEATGFVELQIDEETELDQWGNNCSEFVDEIKSGKIGVQDVLDWFDVSVSDMDLTHEVKVYDDRKTYLDDFE